MSWNHRITREKIPTFDGSDAFIYAIREVYYDSEGRVEGWTKDAVAASGDSVEDVVWELERMVAAQGLGVLDLETRETFPLERDLRAASEG